jgi:hypothetical protein
MQDGVEFRKFVGLKNTVDRERLGPDELELAVNIDLDDLGQIHRRKGYKLAAAGNYGSLFRSNEGIVYGVKNGSLGIINPDFSFDALQGGYSNATVCYVQVGTNIYFSSGDAGLSGIINQVARTVGPWGSEPDIFLSPVVNPTLTLPAIRGRLIGKPPLATSLAYFNGRIYLAQGFTLWATELFLYNFVEKVTNFLPFEAGITMVGSVTDGLYVGTQEGVWFLSGPFKEMKRVRVMDSPVLSGSLAYIPQELANPPQVGLDQNTAVAVSLLFMTEAGYCTGRDSGQCYNETEAKVIFPSAVSAAATFRQQSGINQYIAVLNSAGTPASSARIGDYVSAELVRAGTWRETQDRVCLEDSFTVEIVT